MKIAIVSGRVVRDARTITNVERPFTAFSIAVSEKSKKDAPPSFVDCIASGIGLAQYLTKGKAVEVMGEFNVKEYTDKNGVHHANLAISAQSIHFSPQTKIESDGEPNMEAPQSYPPQDPFGQPAPSDKLPF